MHLNFFEEGNHKMKRILIAVLALFCSSAYAERLALSGQFEKVIIQMEDNKVVRMPCVSPKKKLYRLEGWSDTGGMIAWGAVCVSGESINQKQPATADWIVFHHESIQGGKTIKSVSFVAFDCMRKGETWLCNNAAPLKKATVKYERVALEPMDPDEALKAFLIEEAGEH